MRKNRPQWLDELTKKYEDTIAEMRAKDKPVSTTMWKRLKMCRDGDVGALKAESCFLTPTYDLRSTEKGDTMKKKASKKKEARVTASSILIRLLGAAHVKSDEDLIEEVKGETGSSKFDKSQLAWYKWKYRQGALKGMDGKTHSIEQGSAKKVKKAKKVIIKDRRAKEPVEA